MVQGINKGKVVGFVLAFSLLLISYALLLINTRKVTEQAVLVEHTNKVINTLEQLASEYRTMELNFRVFMASRSDRPLENYFIALKGADSLYAVVKKATSDNHLQQSRLDILKTAFDKKVASIKASMDTAGPVAPVILVQDFFKSVGYTTTSIAPIINQIKQIEYAEGALLANRAADLNGFNNSILTINIVSLVIALILAIYSIITYIQENDSRQRADENSEQYKKELESRINELASANKEIIELRNTEKFASTGRIARTIAHEVRNPLTNINLAAEQLKESIVATDENKMLLDMVKRNGIRINQLISDLLNATKFSELKFEKQSLNLIIDHALEFADDRIRLKNIKIEKHYANDICDINVDEEKIKIAFLNIIVNALEAMQHENGVLKITTENYGKKCRVIFEDNGSGMNEETIAKLFEPFFTCKEKGNGLGLTNTQNIILNHKGKIEVESQPGKGTSFTVILEIS
ncbi:MAG: ATP-binding protein [Ferruginibacter sp.]